MSNDELFNVKPGEYTIDVVVQVPALTPSTQLKLPTIEHITRVYLNEWEVGVVGSVADSNGGVALFNPSLIRLDFSGAQFDSHVHTNLPGAGYPLPLTNAGATHTRYDRPRLLGKFSRGYLSVLPLSLSGCTAQFTGPLTQHGGVTLCMTLVCKNPNWNPDERVALTLAEPRFIDVQGGGRMGWQ